MFKFLLKPILIRYRNLLSKAEGKDVDGLYKLLYNAVHDLEKPLKLAATQTKDTFSFQWEELSVGEYMITDPWFKENVARIVSEEEVLIKSEWFKGKKVLDAGCGGGRWSYGLSELGANVTCVDINESALDFTKDILKEFDTDKKFVQTPLEELDTVLNDEKFDLVWSWGVTHHCENFTKSFTNVANRVREGGVIYLYLYGRSRINYSRDIGLFKQRIRYNTLESWEEKRNFLLEKAKGDESQIHQLHDLFAPLINRRFYKDEIAKMLTDLGFNSIEETLVTGEVRLKAIKGEDVLGYKESFLNKVDKDKHWFNHHDK